MLPRSLHVLRRSRCLCAIHCLKLHTSVRPVLYPRFDKDLPNPNALTPASKLYGPNTDILLDQLKKCDSVDRLLEMINSHLGVMNCKHIVSCLEIVDNCLKADSAAGRHLLENSVFKSFCSRLMKVIRLLDPQEAITTYKVLCALGVRNNTYVMQGVLKMLAAHINNMSLGQLTFLSFLLHRQRHNGLVDGLRLALPLVLQAQIDQQLNSDRLTEVVNCLQLSCRAGLKPDTLQKIVKVILQKAPLLSTTDSVTILFSLLNIDTPIDGYNDLMVAAFETVSRNIEEVSPTKLNTILKTCRSQRFSNCKFFFALADFAVSQKWSLELTYSALSHFSSLGFCTPQLLDHFAQVLCAESEQYCKNSQYSPLTCIEHLTALSYRPAKVDEAAQIVYSAEEKLEKLRAKYPHLYVKFHSHLAMLGHFPPQFLTKMLDEDFLCNAWSYSKKLGKGKEFEHNVLSLSWGLELYEESLALPPALLKKVIHSVHCKHLSADPPLRKFIEHGLGGPQFVQSGVVTEEGHFMDHVIAMRSGNFPVSLESAKSRDGKKHLVFVEDFVLPEDAKIIAIIVARECDYFREVEILRGWPDLKVRSLAKRNYGTLVINYNVWSNLPDREKIPYLMREIKQVALGPDDTLHSNCSGKLL